MKLKHSKDGFSRVFPSQSLPVSDFHTGIDFNLPFQIPSPEYNPDCRASAKLIDAAGQNIVCLDNFLVLELNQALSTCAVVGNLALGRKAILQVLCIRRRGSLEELLMSLEAMI